MMLKCFVYGQIVPATWLVLWYSISVAVTVACCVSLPSAVEETALAFASFHGN